MTDDTEKKVGLFLSASPDETRIHVRPDGMQAGASLSLPFRLLLASDLVPHIVSPEWGGASRVTRVDRNSFAAYIAQMAPRLVLEVPNTISDQPRSLDVELTFTTLKDFEPERVAMQVPVLVSLIEARALIEQVQTGELELKAFQSRLNGLGVDRARAEQLAAALSRQAEPAKEEPPQPPQAAAPPPESSDPLNRLLGMMDTGQGPAAEEPPSRLIAPQLTPGGGLFGALLGAAAGSRQIARQTASESAARALEVLNAWIAEQLLAILEHPAFRQLEAAWRGLKFLVDRLNVRSGVVLDVLPVGRQDLSEALYHQVLLPEHRGEQQESPLLAVILDVAFDNTQRDVALLEDLADTGASLQVPVVASVSARFFGLKAAQGLSRIPVLRQHLEGPDYIAWNKLRDNENARYLALVAPPFVLRAPYGEAHTAASVQVPEYEPLWGNGALALAPVIASSFVHSGWPSRISGKTDGLLDDLPVWRSSAGHVPLAAVLSTERQADMAEAGFVVLACEPDRDILYVAHAPTIRHVGSYVYEEERMEALAHASLASQLFVARAAHYLLAFQNELRPGAVLSDVQSDLMSRLRAVLRSAEGTAEDSVQVEPAPGSEAQGNQILAVRLRPPTHILPQPISLVMGIHVPDGA